MRRMRIVSWLMLALVGLLVSAAPAAAQKKTLVVALNQDPDILDPTLSRTYVGRIVFAHMCEKLYEIDEKPPHLAPARRRAARRLGRRQDGHHQAAPGREVQRRHRDERGGGASSRSTGTATLKGSNRRSELEPVTAVEVVDPLTVRLRLKAPFAPLVATLADRAGMPVSPAAVNKLGDKFGDRAGVRGPVAVRGARAAGPHRGGEVAALLRSRPAKLRPARLPDHPRRQRAAGQPAVGRHRLHAPGGAHRRGEPQAGGALRGLERDRHRLQRHHHQPAQQDRQDPARPAIWARRWPTTRGCARPSSCRIDREALEPGGVGRPVHAGLHADLAR